MPDIKTLIPDILNLLSNLEGTEIKEEAIDEFGKRVASIIKERTKVRERSGALRMSAIGKPARQLYYDQEDITNGVVRPIDGQKALSFIYGSLIEELVLFLAEQAGHKVSRRQEEVDVDGVKGHLDAYIDDTLVDVKSSSDFGFRKFKDGSILNGDDTFGYIPQLSGYAQANGDLEARLLCVNKSSGEMCFVEINDLDMVDSKALIKDLKIKLQSPTPPPRCYEPVPDGKSGNMTLAKGCTWCPHFKKCWKGELRAFKYVDGIKYLTHVARTPNVEEIKLDD